MGWLIALGILVLLALLPLGVRIRYDQSGFTLHLFFGVVTINLLPASSSGKKKKEQTAEHEKKTKTGKKTEKKNKKGGSYKDFLPFAELALKFLGDLRRKIRISRLELNLVMASEDPCDLAINYGKAWASVGNLMPLLERIFVIRKRNIQVQCDFLASSTTLYLFAKVSITLGRAIALLGVYGFKALREYLKFKKLRKGGVSE